jgi:uncharacterized phage protein (TIGR01671 family)
MRTYKFRAWDKKLKRMFIVYSMQLGADWIVYDSNNQKEGISVFEDIDAVLMQFTGLKDKNGKEIYEGDIVKGTGFDEGVEYKDLVGEVYQAQTGAWCVRCRHTMSLFDLPEPEVIGNIYENPELLTTPTEEK